MSDATVPTAAPAPKPDPTESRFGRMNAGDMVRGRFRYQLKERKGVGAFGAVWRATCLDAKDGDPEAPPKDVAIKFFARPATDYEAGFIRRELSALLALRADRVPRVYDWVVGKQVSFFVMKYYEHGSLDAGFKLAGSLDDESSWRVLTDLLKALQSAHRAGILHLDIKPANVMLDGLGGYLLLDFGISQSSQVYGGTAQTVGAGSPGYQAPEQRRMDLDKLDTRTDLWGVGATVWAMRSGLDLKKHKDKLIVDVRGSGHALPRLDQVCPDCSPRLSGILMDLLYDDPADRPGGAAEVLSKVRASTTGSPLDVEYTSTWSRPKNAAEVERIVQSLMDPLWASICEAADMSRYFATFKAGETLCREGDESHHAFVLLHGKVSIERGGKQLAVEHREGTWFGELSTLTGTPRGATVKAIGPVWCCVFNAAEFERLLAFNPAVGIRLVKLMADRLISESQSLHA